MGPLAMVELSRDVPLVDEGVALLVIDAQNYCWVPGRGVWAGEPAGAPSSFYWASVAAATDNIAALLAAARDARAERVYTVIEALTKDQRDLSLDYKISGLGAAKGSWDARVIDALAPQGDEITLPKTSSSVFVSTNCAYVLRSLEIKQLVICGGLTDQCVESAVRDACDEGFLVTLATDACVAKSKEAHERSLQSVAGYCRQRTTAELVAELAGTAPPPAEAADDAAKAKAAAVLARAKANAYVRFEVTDLHAKAISKTVPARHALTGGVFVYSGALAMGANAEVLVFPPEVTAAGCPNWRLAPDWATLVRLPWASTEDRDVFRVYCGIRKGTTEESPLLGTTPRVACGNALDALKEATGLEVLAASELEFVAAKAPPRGATPATPLFEGVDIFATLQFMKAEALGYAIAEGLEPVGVDVKTMNCEYGRGQLEITIAPQRGLAAADAAATFKTAVKEIAARQGGQATFMSKPLGGVKGVGNGGHFNFSLWRGDESAQHDPADADGLSPTARSFLAGVLAHAPGLEALAAPTPSCYARHGNWAPTKNDWGFDDRMRCVRVKADPKGSPGSSYFEYRAPSAAANAHLVMAGLAVAGADGLKRNLKLGPPGDAEGQLPLATCLEDALAALEADALLCEALGADFVSWFLLVKRGELAWLEKATARYVAEGLDADEATQAAWNEMYFEYV